MWVWIDVASTLCAAMTLLPTLVLAAELMLALSPRRRRTEPLPARPARCTVLIPAHNEQDHIRQTIESVATNAPDARILVVADNCQDETALRARRSGAEVIERVCSTHLGKAHALGFGVRHLRTHQPPDAVVVVDADARVKGMSLTWLGTLAVTWNRPVQALNVIDRSRRAVGLSPLTILGNRFHNVVRPLAMQRLGVPCLLMGSGMAFPWQLVKRVGLDNSSLGEDKRLGIDMMLAGHAPVFCLETKVASPVAEQGEGYVGQRKRWEQGHLLVAAWGVPRLVLYALRQGKFDYLATALDLCVPPVAVLAALLMVSGGLALTSALLHAYWVPWSIVLVAAVLLLGTLWAAWYGFARRRVSARSLWMLPRYVWSKLPVYLSWLRDGPQRVWLRTERSGQGKSEGPATKNT